MLIISSVIVFLISIIAIVVFLKRSYIKNRAESVFIIIAITGFNITILSICLYFAQYGLPHYLLNRYLFISQNTLYHLRDLSMNLFEISNVLNLGRFMFMVGIYCFVSTVTYRRMTFRKDWVVIIPCLFFLINISDIYVLFVKWLQSLSVSFPDLINAFDILTDASTALLLIILTVRLLLYCVKPENSALRKNVIMHILGLNMIWLEYAIIFDLTPYSMANIYQESLVVSLLSDVMVTAYNNSLLFTISFITFSVIVLSFTVFLITSLEILRYHNFQKAGTITVSRSIPLGGAANLTPFLHSFKNQLVSLKQFERMMNVENFEKTYLAVRDITDELVKMVDNLYENSKEIHFIINLHDINECIQKAIESVYNKKRVVIEHNKQPPVFAMIDCTHMQHAIENILYNSVDACEQVAQPQIIIHVTSEKRFVNVCISDNGIGISDKNLKKIFDPFFSTKRNSHSWGMGLNHVMKIIKAHGGYVRYNSELNCGTEVILRIPTGR